MKILTSAQMKEIDRKAIAELGIPGTVLMENAGIRIVEVLARAVEGLEEAEVVVVAGKGNNGGDGFVVARHLHNMGLRPSVLLLASKDEVKGDAAVNLNIALRMGIPVAAVRSPEDWKRFKKAMTRADLIVDALFGIGLTKPAEGLYARVIEDINAAPGFKAAVDIPSGLSSDTANIIGPAVRADLTVTLAAPKIAHVLPPAESYIGRLFVAPIGIPLALFDDPGLKVELVERGDVLPLFAAREPDTHKGTYGHVLVVAGSRGKTGAASLAAKAALKMGAGLVTVATPASCLPMIARSMAELMTEPLAETPDGTMGGEGLSRVLELLKGKDALLLGPGISTHPETVKLVLALLPRIRVPLVIDADALNIVASKPDILAALRAPAVLTPHPGEFARLTGLTTEAILEDRLGLVKSFAANHKVHLVLKGHRTLVACPDGCVHINSTGNPGMATGGSGDVLGGMIASQLAQERDI
ncbi:MAG TPA: NAD(P)H-hydrate dehydratase, partial [Acidobacteriota bacterium]|nr:NAD(P)H-hydrate dehydratase [Acidobacteriota bacterium]